MRTRHEGLIARHVRDQNDGASDERTHVADPASSATGARAPVDVRTNTASLDCATFDGRHHGKNLYPIKGSASRPRHYASMRRRDASVRLCGTVPVVAGRAAVFASLRSHVT